MLTYSVSRGELILGRFTAHLPILVLAAAIGYGVAAAAVFAVDADAARGLAALVRLFWTSLLLGATFLGVGYAISAFARRPGAGLAIGLWCSS